MRRTLLPLTAGFLVAVPTAAQLPRVGIIDFYGLHRVTASQLRPALGIAEGDTITIDALDSARARVRLVSGVAAAHLEPVCCEAGRVILYVGVEEPGAAAMRFDPSPRGSARLPDELVRAGTDFDRAFTDAMTHGDFAEDDSQGHALMHYRPARAVQERFVSLAARHASELRDVLHHSGDPEQRALAAQVIAYAADKREVVGDLVQAMADSAPDVRNNATRALALIAALAQHRPELGIAVPTQPFVALLNSIVWTDRNKSSLALAALTGSRDSVLLATLRRDALPALVEMARWRSRGHAYAACLILGRIGGLSESVIGDALQRDDREPLIQAGTRGAK